MHAVDDLLKTREPDVILLESTGIGEPLPIAESFCLRPEVLELAAETGQAHVDAMITVLDSALEV
nr:GTP-binding protein [Deinococcus deserti]